MPYERSNYPKTAWIDVPDPTTPPPGAQELSATNLNKIEEGIRATRESVHLSSLILLDNEQNAFAPADRFPNALRSIMNVNHVSWPVAGVLETITGATPHQFLYSGGLVRIRRSLNTSKANWTASTAYTVGALVQPTINNRNGLFYRCTTAGTSGTTEPAWSTTGTTTDNTVVWTVDGSFWGAWKTSIYDSDTRLSDARTPLAHTHAIGDLPVATSGTSNTTQVVRADDGRLSNNRVPTSIRTLGAAQTLVATDAIAIDGEIKRVSAGAAITLTSAPTIPNGTDGQVLTLFNTGAFNITIQHQGTATGQLANSNLRLSADSLTLLPNNSIRLTFVGGTVSDWFQISTVVAAR